MKTRVKFTIVTCVAFSIIFITVNLKTNAQTVTCMLQGHTYPTNYTIPIEVSLHAGVAPFGVITSGPAVIDLNGDAVAAFPPFPIIIGGFYYISIKGWNLFETWSSVPILVVGGGIFAYDFTTAAGQAFGNNQTFVAPGWRIYQGDIYQNGSIDLTEVLQIYNEAAIFTTGELVTDLSGDAVLDLNDVIIAFNNNINFVTVRRP